MARKNSTANSAVVACESAIVRAKVFWSGRSQAVRLPKEFRVEGSEVLLHRQGAQIILEVPPSPVDRNGWPENFWDILGSVGDDFTLGDREAPPERSDPFLPDRRQKPIKRK